MKLNDFSTSHMNSDSGYYPKANYGLSAKESEKIAIVSLIFSCLALCFFMLEFCHCKGRSLNGRGVRVSSNGTSYEDKFRKNDLQ